MTSWQGQAGTTTERGYGHQWRKLRKHALTRDQHLCQVCQREGKLTPAREVDHIKPKSKGGTDALDNLQSICRPCHKRKSSKEGGEAQQALRDQGKEYIGEDGWPVKPKKWGHDIPHGLQPSAIEVVIICGPPGSGKTTYAQEHAAPSDKIIDLDEILVRIGGDPWDNRKRYVRKALAYRDMMIRGLSQQVAGRAWLVITGNTPEARDAWREALGPKSAIKVMDTAKATCVERVASDPKRKHAVSRLIKLIDEWT